MPAKKTTPQPSTHSSPNWTLIAIIAIVAIVAVVGMMRPDKIGVEYGKDNFKGVSSGPRTDTTGRRRRRRYVAALFFSAAAASAAALCWRSTCKSVG
jgi:hypothetical protein